MNSQSNKDQFNRDMSTPEDLKLFDTRKVKVNEENLSQYDFSAVVSPLKMEDPTSITTQVIEWLNSLDYFKKEQAIKNVLNGTDFSICQLESIAEHCMNVEQEGEDLFDKVFPYTDTAKERNICKSVKPNPDRYVVPTSIEVKSLIIEEKRIAIKLVLEESRLKDDPFYSFNKGGKTINFEVPFNTHILQNLKLGQFYKLVLEEAI